MSFAEIKKAVNSNLDVPLNEINKNYPILLASTRFNIETLKQDDEKNILTLSNDKGGKIVSINIPTVTMPYGSYYANRKYDINIVVDDNEKYTIKYVLDQSTSEKRYTTNAIMTAIKNVVGGAGSNAYSVPLLSTYIGNGSIVGDNNTYTTGPSLTTGARRNLLPLLNDIEFRKKADISVKMTYKYADIPDTLNLSVDTYYSLYE